MTGVNSSAKRAAQEDQRYLSSVDRAFSILEALSANPRSQTLTELSRATGIAIPSLQRMTRTLEECGYLAKDEKTKRYAPAIKTVDLLHNYLASNELAKTAWPHLVRLRESSGLGVSFAVPNGNAMIYVHRLPGYRGDFENTLPGKMISMHLSASGRCALASWPAAAVDEYCAAAEFAELTQYTVRSASELKERLQRATDDGYCIVEQEVSTGVTSIAVPVRAGATVVAGISLHATSIARIEEQVFQSLVVRLMQVGRALSSG